MLLGGEPNAADFESESSGQGHALPSSSKQILQDCEENEVSSFGTTSEQDKGKAVISSGGEEASARRVLFPDPKETSEHFNTLK